MLTSQNLTRRFHGCKSKSNPMKKFTPFLLLSLTLLSVAFTGKGQSDSVKVIPVETYGSLVEDAVQRRVLDTLVTTLQEQLHGMESIHAQIENYMSRQFSIMAAENQALEIQTTAWESKYGVLEKQLGKKEKGNKWLKVAVGAAFVLGLFAGK